MPVTVPIDGVSCTIEKLASGLIRVTSAGGQINPMHGPGTGGPVWYDVHRCQRNQFDWLNLQLPPSERSTLSFDPATRPWWSLGAGERANLRE